MNMGKDNHTITFSLKNAKDDEMKRTLNTIYAALMEKGYDPLNQLVGYLLTEDPTYITSHNGARTLIRKLDRDELLHRLLKSYLDIN